jgi:hypothetical protein
MYVLKGGEKMDQAQNQRKLTELYELYREYFNHLSIDEKNTLEFYFNLCETRGVDGLQYVRTAIERAHFKGSVKKPISYVASLCKSFLSRGLYAQPFQEELDILYYIKSKIGNISSDNIKLIQAAISTNGSTRVAAATAEILNNSNIQDEIVNKIILKVVEIFGKPETV